jgi:hypothetical protein
MGISMPERIPHFFMRASSPSLTNWERACPELAEGAGGEGMIEGWCSDAGIVEAPTWERIRESIYKGRGG